LSKLYTIMSQNLILFSESDLRLIVSETVRNEIQSFKQVEKTQDSNLLTRQETAQILGISLPTLYNYSKDGRLPYYRIGSRIRYKKDEVLNSLSLIQTSKFKR
jgi:excisionase family DNA binding protein